MQIQLIISHNLAKLTLALSPNPNPPYRHHRLPSFLHQHFLSLPHFLTSSLPRYNISLLPFFLYFSSSQGIYRIQFLFATALWQSKMPSLPRWWLNEGGRKSKQKGDQKETRIERSEKTNYELPRINYKLSQNSNSCQII